MAFTSIDIASIQSGKAITGPVGFGVQVKDNLDSLYGLSASAGGGGVANGSFEIDSDGDGNPDSWTDGAGSPGPGLYAGGLAEYYTTSPAHGAKSWSFIHPGGVSNGGGYMDSDYIEISPEMLYFVRFIHWATAAGMKNIVQARYFDKAKEVIGSPVDLYNSVANPAAASPFCYQFNPPATAQYLKVRIIGGFTDTDVAGTAYFDDINLIVAPPATPTTPGLGILVATAPTERNTVSTSFVKLKEITLAKGGIYTVTFDIKTSSGTQYANGQIFKDGVAWGTDQSTASETYVSFSENLLFRAGKKVQLYAKIGAGQTAYVQNFNIYEKALLGLHTIDTD